MEFLRRLFDTDFMPHGHCYFWNPSVLWPNVIGDGVIALSYFVIPFLLFRFLRKRPDVKFRGIFIAFAAFIFACGTTHAIDVISVWHPMYRLEGLVKVITAVISGGTVLGLFHFFPAVISIPTPEQWTEAKIAAANSARRFRLLIEHAPVGVAITNFNGEFIEVNEVMCSLFNYSAEEFAKMSFIDVTHPDDINQSIHAKDNLASGERKFLQFEKRYVRKDGSYFWAMVSATAVPEEKCNLVHITDISNRILDEQKIKEYSERLEGKIEQSSSELREINKDLENFIYAVTHDLRVPLHNLQGLSAVLEEELAGVIKPDNEAYAAFRMIGENAQKMDNLVTDLLAFSKMSKLEIVKTEVDIQSIIRATLDEQKAIYGDKKIDLQIGSLPKAYGDRIAIQQVCQNLIGNALKYSSQREVIHLAINGKIEDGRAVYSFSDNGIGFDPQYANKMFLPFQRLHHAEEFEGTGIGLATSQRIIQKHGGRIWAEGKPNQGATFYFSLPLNA